jgi:hypothetical protein
MATRPSDAVAIDAQLLARLDKEIAKAATEDTKLLQRI